MSTIASPRDPTTFRRTNSSQAIATPTSSARPSLDVPRSGANSPNPGNASLQPASGKRNNRAALREYYNLKKTATSSTPPLLEITDTESLGDDVEGSYSEVPLSEIDVAGFQADAYIETKLRDSSLEELLRTYTRIVGEIRALDAEKKALVYDNYSKLITATETIRKMRANMDPLNPMASTLDPAITQIYSQASSIRETMRLSALQPAEGRKVEEQHSRTQRTRELVNQVLRAPERIRKLMREDKTQEAEEAWTLPRQLLVSWREKGLGGKDLDVCLREGDEALRGATTSGT
ncbi:Vps51/Vps67-domain-containing protein [Coniella lustricola]|uniref:Vacuolar protein sorting-associated protein 51 homolog n=1 Tax=Coniella lustricola TaxID=2025994 RepID=A0A2T2ZYY8_9PEZI|nr:Vps51/Vps67-domain-containing protein [Coniella lustricola]